MSAAWMGFAVFMAVIAAILGAAATGSSLSVSANSTYPSNDIQYILHYAVLAETQSGGFSITSMLVDPEFFAAMFRTLVMQQNLHSIFTADTAWIWIWFMVWVPIIATVLFGIAILFISIIQRVL